jgi:hypothetical protein
MYNLKGFIGIDALVNNTVGTIAPIGEASTWALTFSKERSEYISADSAGVRLIGLSSTQDGVKVVVSDDFVEHVLEVTKWVYDHCVNKNGEVYSDELAVAILTQFQDTAGVFQIGNIVSNGSLWMPSWISWTHTAIAGSGTSTSVVFKTVDLNSGSDGVFTITYRNGVLYSVTSGGMGVDINYASDGTASIRGSYGNYAIPLTYTDPNSYGNSSYGNSSYGNSSYGNTVVAANQIKVWFSDAALRLEYDEYEIVVVTPLTPVDDFFKTSTNVQTQINERTAAEAMDLIQTTKDGKPETIIRTMTYNYSHPDNPTLIVPTNWTVLIYGPGGDNPDSIKDALIEHVLSNSTHTQAEWAVILPDLFKRTEFIILPRWDKYAVPNKTTQAGLYSSVVGCTGNLNFMVPKVPFYAEAHIRQYATLMGHPYRYLTLAVIGSPDNRNSLFRIDNVFSDYIDAGTTSIDFNRMALPTQEFCYALEEMLIYAETMTANSAVPSSMRKLTRNNYLYVVQTIDNIQYLVAAKINYAG